MTHFTSASDTSSGSGVLVMDVDVVHEGVVAVMLTVVLVDKGAGAFATGVTTATGRSGIVVGTGCADCVVVLSAGAKASCRLLYDRRRGPAEVGDSADDTNCTPYARVVHES